MEDGKWKIKQYSGGPETAIYFVEGSCAFGGKICPLQEKSNGHKSSAEADDGCDSEVEQENGIIFQMKMF